MRIIAGAFKRTLIPAAPGTATRPTTDRMRESIFDVLDRSIVSWDVHVLDLYAGSGILTWEAFSRGARSATLIDTSAQICRHLRSVAISLGISERVEIIRTDGPTYLRTTKLEGVGLAFADPPYAIRHGNMVLNLLSGTSVLNRDAMLVIEHGDQEFILPCNGFEPTWHSSFGGSVVDILRRVGPVA